MEQCLISTTLVVASQNNMSFEATGSFRRSFSNPRKSFEILLCTRNQIMACWKICHFIYELFSYKPPFMVDLPLPRLMILKEYGILYNNSSPIGSMYGIYAKIWGILMVNVTIYTIHGSYGSQKHTSTHPHILGCLISIGICEEKSAPSQLRGLCSRTTSPEFLLMKTPIFRKCTSHPDWKYPLSSYRPTQILIPKSTYNPIDGMYNPIHSQLSLTAMAGHNTCAISRRCARRPTLMVRSFRDFRIFRGSWRSLELPDAHRMDVFTIQLKKNRLVCQLLDN